MKKIALFSMLVLCVAVVQECKAAGRRVFTDDICYGISVSGSMEQGKCKKSGNSYKEFHEPCSPLHAPVNSGWCIHGQRSGTMACAAKECDSGYLLYTTNTRQEVSVKNTSGKVGSQGICYEKTFLEQKCANACKNCRPDERCELNEITVLQYGKEVSAFIGEEACFCKGSPKPVTPPVKPVTPPVKPVTPPVKPVTPPVKPVTPVTECKYIFDGTIICNGVTEVVHKEKILTESELNGRECDEFNRLFANDANMYKELFGDLCKSEPGPTTVPEKQRDTGPSEYAINNAKKTLEAFSIRAEDERSVWRNAEGKFNTARLASDITAGVVLGTVGGVVTGVVIKKNQVKKGFEALHCTVGGQRVAEWGDEFSVGLLR